MDALRFRAWFVRIACTTGLAATTGCQPFFPLPLPREERHLAHTPTGSTLPATPDGSTPAVHLSALGSDGWVMAGTPSAANRTRIRRRWRHPQLESLLNRPADQRPDLTAQLQSPYPVVAANAAIVLAGWSEGNPTDRLVKSVRSTELKLPLRCAAAEALGRVQQPETLHQIRELIDEYAPSTGENQPYVPELHVALLAALSEHASPGDDTRFISAAKSASPQVRLEVVEAWLKSPGLSLPRAIVDLRDDADPRVRARALQAIVLHRYPQAHEHLELALNDLDLSVRLTAVAQFGQLGGEQARASLERLRNHPSEATRAAAIAALAHMGIDKTVLGAATDKSWQVRQAVAQALAAAPQNSEQIKRQAAALAEDLLRDTSSEVQRRAVEAVAEWPLEQAGPVLLIAMGEASYLTRKTAAAKLAARWAPAADFPADAPPERRAAALAELRRRWAEEFGLVDLARAAYGHVDPLVRLSSERIEQLDKILKQLGNQELSEPARQAARIALASYGPDLILALDQWAEEHHEPLPPVLFTDLLPQASRIFAELHQLQSADNAQRRAAIGRLVNEAAGRPLPAIALKRLAELVEAEPDPLVWQAVLTLIAQDGREAAGHLAHVAIAHTSIEVRRRACEYLAAHPDARHAAVLLSSLADADMTVVRAAVRALGRLGNLDDPQPLIQLLLTPDRHLRLEVAVSLARLRRAEGIAALERLAQETDVEIRRQCAVAMGELGDPALIPTLIQLLEDRADVQSVAVASLVHITGRDVAAANGSLPLNPSEKARRWQQWYREQQGSASVDEPQAGARS